MTATKIVMARKSGRCAAEFFHPDRIEPGDRILVVTTFPRDEPNCWYDRPFFSRARLCSWCLARELDGGWRVYPRPKSHDSSTRAHE